jgi:hypothetical protein
MIDPLLWGWSSGNPLLWGWTDEVTTATPIDALQPQPYYKLHGFNRMRLFKWGGRFPPRR